VGSEAKKRREVVEGVRRGRERERAERE